MGVYIPNMKMPEHCGECRFAVDGWCYAYGKPNIDALANDGRTNFCPLVPVPPHGDLIDRDALRASIGESIDECHKWADEVDQETMIYARISQSIGTFVECSLRAKAAPTIIPAEEGE